MKKLMLFILLASALLGADAANDVLISQRNPGNTGNIQRNVGATGAITNVATFRSQLGIAPLASPTFTGTVTIPTPFTLGAVSVTATGTEINFLSGVGSAIQTQLNAKAPLASPTFTGTPAAPTAAADTSTTQIASTAFAKAEADAAQAASQPLDAALTALSGGSDFVAFTGPAASIKNFALPNASATILSDNAAVTVPQGGTGRATGTTAYGLIAAGTTATGIQQTLAVGATTEILVGGGAAALPIWTTATGSGAPVRATSPTVTGISSNTYTSTVATGTAPLTITSTTNVANLNASSLNGATFSAPGAIGGGTPAAGSFTTLGATGAISPSQTAGITGTTTNNSVNAGGVGEELKTTVASGSAVSLTTATSTNLATQSLTAGDWDVFVTFIYIPGATTSITQLSQGISQTTATLPTTTTGAGDYTVFSTAATVPGANNISQTVGPFRVSLSGTTNVFAVARPTFTISTLTVYGSIRARRVR